MNYLSKDNIRRIIYLFLLGIVAWLFGKATWMFLYAEPPTIQQPNINLNQVNDEVPITLSGLYLFGKAKVEKAQTPTEPLANEPVKKSSLNLKLLGVVIAPSMSVAIIEKSGKPYSYAVGEEIQDGVNLQALFEQYAVVSNRGVLEKLEMEKAQSLFADEPQSSNQLNARQLGVIERVKQKAIKNPISIVRYVRFNNVIQKGKLKSIKVWPRQEKAIFNALGFMAGDEIIKVQGKSVDILSKSSKDLQNILKESEFSVVVNRRGEEVPLTIKLK